MGIVLRGRDRLTGRAVALKTVRGDRRSDAASIRREIVALGQLSHPGIVRLLADGTWDDKPWMALELLDGRTVCDEIALLWRKGPEGLFQAQHGRCRSDDLPTMPSQIRSVRRAGPHPTRPSVRVAGRGPAARCHQHREEPVRGAGLRPRARPGPSRRQAVEHLSWRRWAGDAAWISAWSARRAESRAAATAADSCVGTMEYAAPEQIRGESVDARADIYSFGCVLYELVTGQRPGDGDRATVSGVPPALDDLLRAMLARRPGDRPATAGAVAARLAEIPTTGPDGAHPASENPTMTAQTARIDAATITMA